jgi:pimeloyl-ACP methyl ester carboxylesterase
MNSQVNVSEHHITLRLHGSPELPTLIYLPGIHGDWTLIACFRQALGIKVRFVEITYPRATEWTLTDYAQGIESALLAAGVNGGWLLAESFGSQPAWEMIRRQREGKSSLNYDGLILAGGFVKHPWPWGARFLRTVTAMTPRWLLRVLLAGYATYARFRHRHAPETLADIAQFVANRLHPDDPAAMMQRYTIIIENDLRSVAREARLPVFQLTGMVDPIVPWPLTAPWLRKHCPTLKDSRIIHLADHNVLATAPSKSASLVLSWMQSV